METQVKKTGEHKRELTVQTQGDIVKEKFSEVYKRINKEAKVPGFRPGNVPQDILEKHYSGVAQQEILKELLPEVYNQALAETGLEPVDLPEISQVNLDKYSLSFKANVEVKPKIELKNYKGLSLECKPIQVTEEEVNQAFDKLKQSHPQISEQDCAHSLGFANQEDLKGVLEKQIYLEKTKAQQMNLENNIIEQLLSQVSFQVPLSLINRQLDNLTQQTEIDLVLRGMSKEDVQKQRPRIKENLEPQARRQVRVFLVLEEVARRENIPRGEKMAKQAIEFLLRHATW